MHLEAGLADGLGQLIHQSSMEAGERWMLNDVTGKPIRASRRSVQWAIDGVEQCWRVMQPLLDNPTNKKFVKDFRAAYGGKVPDGFACQGYDTAQVIVRSLKALNGNSQDKDKWVDAIAKVEFDSPRGRFRFDPKTHNVIQPFIYIRKVEETALGLNNVPIDKVADVRDPGTGCTLPA